MAVDSLARNDDPIPTDPALILDRGGESFATVRRMARPAGLTFKMDVL